MGTEDALFLHGGPGLDCRAERQWFDQTWPILWWDQPKAAPGDPAPYWSLVAAARDRLARLAQNNGAPAHLVAHSFGCQIALDISRHAPQIVRSLTLLAAVPDPYVQLLRLGRHLVAKGRRSDALDRVLDSPDRKRTPERFQALAGALGALPDLFDHQWGPDSTAALARFKTLVPEGVPIDIESFLAIQGHQMTLVREPAPLPFRGTVRVILGRADPLLDCAADADWWHRWYPQAEVSLVDSGHWVQFELPAECWLPEAAAGRP